MTAHAGTLLREARTARGLRQHYAARLAGISPERLSALENGRDHVRPGDADRLGPVLGIGARELLLAPRPPHRPMPPSAWRAEAARSFREIPASCPCDWHMRFEGGRPAGWELETAEAKCRHHGERG